MSGNYKIDIFEAINQHWKVVAFSIAMVGSAVWNQYTTTRLYRVVFSKDRETPRLVSIDDCENRRGDCMAGVKEIDARHIDEIARLRNDFETMREDIRKTPHETVRLLKDVLTLK